MFHSKVMAKYNFFAALALSALRRLRVHSDLQGGTAFDVLPLAVCTKGLMYCRNFAPSFCFLGIADPTSTGCRLVLLAHAAPYCRPHPPTTHACIVPAPRLSTLVVLFYLCKYGDHEFTSIEPHTYMYA